MRGCSDKWWKDVIDDRIKRRIVTVPARYVPPVTSFVRTLTSNIASLDREAERKPLQVGRN
jgi:hypothetical protein